MPGPRGAWVWHHEIGLVDHLVADDEHIDVERTRTPTFALNPVLSGLEALGNDEEGAGAGFRIDRDDRGPR